MKRICAYAMLLFVLLLSGCAKVQQAQQEAPELLMPVGVKLDTQAVLRGDLYKLTVYDGEVIPYTEGLTFLMDGTLLSMDVLPGQQVKAGDVLARLDESALAEQHDALARQIVQEEALWAIDQEITALDIRLKRLALDQATQAYTAAKDAAAERALISQQNAYEKCLLDAAQETETRMLKLDAMRQRLATMAQELGRNTIVAPFDGRIVYITQKRPGARILKSEYAVFLVDDTRLSLQSVFISMSETRNAHALYARIGDQDFQVTPDEVDMGEYIARALAGAAMEITYTFDEPPTGIHSGEYAAIHVVTGYLEDVLYIPSNALYTDASGRYVYRVVGEERVRTAVTTGGTNGIHTAITSGLSEGDVVYVKE